MDMELHGDFVGHAQNLWRRFPQVFAVFGAPDVESAPKVDADDLDGEHGSIIEALLPWRDAGVLEVGGVAKICNGKGSAGEIGDGKHMGAGGGWAGTGGDAEEAPATHTHSGAGEISSLALRRGFAISPVDTGRPRAERKQKHEDGGRVERQSSKESMGTLIERIAVRNPLSGLISL